MRKAESEVVNPYNYKHFADNIISRRYKDQPDELFEKLNNNHPKTNYANEMQ